MSDDVKHLKKSDFKKVVQESMGPVLVDFWAPWCGPCQMIGPELEAAASELKGKATIAKVNVDEEPELAEEFGVRSIPNLVIFRGGKVIKQMIGFQAKQAILNALI